MRARGRAAPSKASSGAPPRRRERRRCGIRGSRAVLRDRPGSRHFGGLFADSLGTAGLTALVGALGTPNLEERGGAGMLMGRIGLEHAKNPEFRAALERAMAREKVEEVRSRMVTGHKANSP